jgi:hypothetical protein
MTNDSYSELRLWGFYNIDFRLTFQLPISLLPRRLKEVIDECEVSGGRFWVYGN